MSGRTCDVGAAFPSGMPDADLKQPNSSRKPHLYFDRNRDSSDSDKYFGGEVNSSSQCSGSRGEPEGGSDWRWRRNLPRIMLTDAKWLYDKLQKTVSVSRERHTMIHLL